VHSIKEVQGIRGTAEQAETAEMTFTLVITPKTLVTQGQLDIVLNEVIELVRGVLLYVRMM
jgi:hypothetical protein